MGVYSDIASRAAKRCGEGCAKTAVKVAACEAGGNPTNTNSLGCYGLYQWCPQNSNHGRAKATGADVGAQVDLFLEESADGSRLDPWAASKACWSASGGKADKAWEDAVSGMGSLSSGGVVPGGVPNPADAVGGAIAAAVDWLLGGKSPAEVAVRFLELVGGATVLAVGGVMILEVLSTPGTRAAKGVVSKSAGMVMSVVPGGGAIKGAAKVVT